MSDARLRRVQKEIKGECVNKWPLGEPEASSRPAQSNAAHIATTIADASMSVRQAQPDLH